MPMDHLDASVKFDDAVRLLTMRDAGPTLRERLVCAFGEVLYQLKAERYAFHGLFSLERCSNHTAERQ